MTDPAELRRLLAEALLGPWKATGEFITTPGEAPVFVHYKEDAALIAAAVNALAGLLDRIEALEAANATLKELLALPGGIDDPEAESVVARGGDPRRLQGAAAGLARNKAARRIVASETEPRQLRGSAGVLCRPSISCRFPLRPGYGRITYRG